MYLFVYTPIKKETYPHSVWFTSPCGLFSLKSSISTKSTTRKGRSPHEKPQKTPRFFTEVFLVPFQYFFPVARSRIMRAHARNYEYLSTQLRVLVNPITSTCQQKRRNANIQMRNSFLYTRNSLYLQHKHSQTHEKRSNQLSRQCSY